MYIYKQPSFYIPKEFQDWLVAAYNGKHNWDTVIDISWNWNNWTQNWWVVFSRKNNAHQMSFDGSDDYIACNQYDISTDRTFIFFWTMTWDTSNNHIWMWCNTAPYEMLEVRDGKYQIQYDLNDWNWTHYIDTWVTTANKMVMYWLTYNSNLKEYLVYLDWYLAWTWTNVSYSSTNKNLWVWNGINDDWTTNSEYWEWIIWLALHYNKVLTPQQISKMYEYFRQWYYN